MYRGYKIIPFVPAGRKNTLEVLLNYFVKHSDIIDEVMLWQNTNVASDMKYMKEVENDFFKLYPLPKQYDFKNRVQLNTGRFFEYCTDPEAIYIRFDDDIVYIDDDFFINLLDFRIDNQEYLAVFPNIINNAFCAYRQQEAEVFPREEFNIDDGYCMNTKTWGNPHFGIYIHNLLLDKIDKGRVRDMYFPNLELDRERFSISSFAIMGKRYAGFNGKLENLEGLRLDEEIWLTEWYPGKYELKNAVIGNAVCAHYTFSPFQKKYIVETDILERYKKISRDRLSDSYYNLL